MSDLVLVAPLVVVVVVGVGVEVARGEVGVVAVIVVVVLVAPQGSLRGPQVVQAGPTRRHHARSGCLEVLLWT